MKPLDALGDQLDKRVIVRLKNGVEITGTLKAFDIHINLVLKEAEITDGETVKKMPDMFLRGDMVLYVA
ncbi:MAG TPA: small nuclear ribonucleoprotein [Candidatus Altiarchaeales archaeon]|nr:small nuclear ribonucleoprotein [Candidatus Altiarchaeales archaeon]